MTVWDNILQDVKLKGLEMVELKKWKVDDKQ